MSFEDVYREHFRFVWRCLQRLGVRESDVGDAVQEVFLVVHRRLAEWEGRSKMTTWLFGICMRVASDRRRAAHVRREVALEEGPTNVGDESAGAAELLERRERVALLEALLDELPLEQRAVFSLFELDEMEGEQIAELLEIPMGTVWSRLRLARESFRAAMRRHSARDHFEAKVARGGT